MQLPFPFCQPGEALFTDYHWLRSRQSALVLHAYAPVRCQAQSSSVKLSQPVLAIFLPLPETATVTHPMSPFTLALNGSVTAVTAPAASAVPVCWSPGFFPQISHQNIFRAMLTPVPPLLGPRRCQCQQLLSTLKLCERQH